MTFPLVRMWMNSIAAGPLRTEIMIDQIEAINTESELEEILTRPRPQLLEVIKTCASPLLILGAGGKMGPTLAVLAKRAAEAAGHPLDVIAVSRFGDVASRQRLEARGVTTLSCDLLDARAVAALPDSENILYLVGLKFGTAQNPSATSLLSPKTIAASNS